MPTTIKQIIWNVNSTLVERVRRLRTLAQTELLPTGSMDTRAAVQTALKTIQNNPERILDWFSEEEIALNIMMEEV